MEGYEYQWIWKLLKTSYDKMVMSTFLASLWKVLYIPAFWWYTIVCTEHVMYYT